MINQLIVLFYALIMHYMPIFVVFCFFAIPLTAKNREKKKQKRINKEKVPLTNKIIFEESRLYGKMTPIIIVMMVFFIFFLYILVYYGNMTMKVTFSIPLILLVYVIVNSTIRCWLIKKGKFVIIEDVLRDKYIYDSRDNNDQYYLYFNDYYKKYNKRISVPSTTYKRAQIGDSFYIVFTRYDAIVVNPKHYQLEDRDKIIPIEELEKYVQIKKKKLKKKKVVVNSHKKQKMVVINSKRLIRDFYNMQQKLDVMLCLTFMCALPLLLTIAFFHANIFLGLAMLVFSILTITLSFVKIGYIFGTIRKLRKHKYRVKVDTVIKINDRVPFKDSNAMMSLKFENCRNLVYKKKKEYGDVAIGDTFYLIFVKGESDPVNIYQTKYSRIED